jgi:hypothetical protein
MKTVFLSHSQQDEQLATRLKADLTKRGLTVRTIDLVEPVDPAGRPVSWRPHSRQRGATVRASFR